MKGFLNFMANCTPQSTRNLLILYEQNHEITHPRTFDKWKEAGRSIRSGEKGYTFFADQEYTKEDGTIANGYTITKAYDISQTRGPQPLPPQQHLPEEIIAAMVENSPVPLAISDQLPQGVQAQYVPKQRTILSETGWMKPQPSAPLPVSRPTPASIWWQRLLPAGVCGPSLLRGLCGGAEIRLGYLRLSFRQGVPKLCGKERGR